MKGWAAVAAMSFTLAACDNASAPVPGLQRNAQIAAVNQGIPGTYIVTLREDVRDVPEVAAALVSFDKGRVTHTYVAALKGFAAELPDASVTALLKDPRVERIENDRTVSIASVQTGPVWGLDRVDQRTSTLDHLYNYATDGSGVTVYVIDTGINFTHSDFGGRAITGVDEITIGGNATDCNGHGTHVSGTVGGATYGIAKNVGLIAVRVLDCNGVGTISGVIAGIDWVTANKKLPAAANLSLTSGYSASLNQAVAGSIAAGITYSVAAGNNAADACNSSPASEPLAITVGATDLTDTFAFFSNYGPCIDINAPGVSVTSDWYSSPTATNTLSGTSMAAPHVTGVAALYLSLNPTAAPLEVTRALTSNATANVISQMPLGTSNLLLYSSFVAVDSSQQNSSSARFTYKCTNLKCAFDGTSSTGASAYSWDFGDGSTLGIGSTVSHTFSGSARTSYIVTLTTSPAGSASTTSKVITCTKKSCT